MSLRSNMQRISSHTTRLVGKHFGEEFPFYYLMEFPKSGGSWLADMIADYLQIPRPVHFVFPIGCTAVIHGHWSYTPGLRRVFYMSRDGRDVAVSMYFRTLWELGHAADRAELRYQRRRFPSLFGPDAGNPRTVLPRFIAEFARKPGGTRLNWAQHVLQWQNREGVVAVTYEELLADTAGTLARILPPHTGREVDPDRIEATVHKFSFAQQTGGRNPGTEDRSSFIRKGISGDWRNHMTREAGRVFDEHFGEALVKLGYESDRDWWRTLPDA